MHTHRGAAFPEDRHLAILQAPDGARLAHAFPAVFGKHYVTFFLALITYYDVMHTIQYLIPPRWMAQCTCFGASTVHMDMNSMSAWYVQYASGSMSVHAAKADLKRATMM